MIQTKIIGMLYVIILSPVFRIHEYGGISGTGQIENTLLNNYYLGQNYLNPFNPATKIKDTLPKEGIVKITIYNSLLTPVRVSCFSRDSDGKYSTLKL